MVDYPPRHRRWHGVLLTANLGAWQLRRAAQKLALESAIDSRADMAPLANAELATGDPAALDPAAFYRTGSAVAAEPQMHRAVRLRGRWVAGHTVFLDNRQMDGRVGFHVVTPLQLAGRSEAVLVQRGFVKRDLRDRTLLPSLATPPGEVEVAGRIAPPPARLYEFAGAASGPIRQNVDLPGFTRETGLRLLPFSVQQLDSPGAPADGLARHWPRPAIDVHKHYGYAFQWFALAALMAGLYVWFQLIRPRLGRRL